MKVKEVEGAGRKVDRMWTVGWGVKVTVEEFEKAESSEGAKGEEKGEKSAKVVKVRSNLAYTPPFPLPSLFSQRLTLRRFGNPPFLHQSTEDAGGHIRSLSPILHQRLPSFDQLDSLRLHRRTRQSNRSRSVSHRPPSLAPRPVPLSFPTTSEGDSALRSTRNWKNGVSKGYSRFNPRLLVHRRQRA